MDLSIIIVNYKTYKLTSECIKSILKWDYDFSYNIYLVDNASCDDSLEELVDTFNEEVESDLIKVISSGFNGGFSYANNLAIKDSGSDYVLLLNSDTIVSENSIGDCLDYIRSDMGIGAVGCRVLLPDGDLDKACRRSFPNISVSFYRMIGLSKLFPNNRRFNKYNLDYLDEKGVYEIDSLVGAFMLIRKSVLDKVGLLDETFFMYGEDIDLCYRIKEAWFKIIYYGKTSIIHYKGTNKKQRSKMIYEFYKSMYIFYNKHYKDQHNIFINIVIYVGIIIMCIIKLFLNILK